MNIKNILHIIIVIMIVLLISGSAANCATNEITLSDTDIDLSTGGSVNVTLMVMNASEIAGVQTTINYDPNVINITNGIDGPDFDYGTFFDYRIPGQLSVYAIMSNDVKSGNLFVGNITIKAVGYQYDDSAITFNATVGCDNSGYYEQFTNIDGFITLTCPGPSVFNPLVDHAIPTDTDDNPMWGETATLSVDCYIAGEDGIESAMIDLSQLGGDVAVPMELVTNETNWVVTASVEITAPASTIPGDYVFPITVTTYEGGVTVFDSKALTVLCNGDINGDSTKDIDDVMALVNVLISVDDVNSVYSAEVTGEGDINVADVVLLINNEFAPEEFILR